MPISPSFCMIITTCSTEKEAQDLSLAVLEKRLAACVQHLPIKSSFWWEDRIQTALEYLLFMKARREDWSRIQTLLTDIHSYETPEILRFDIGDGTPAYLDWLAKVTQK